MHTHTKEFLDSLTPYTAYSVLKEGNERFVNNMKVNRNLLQLMNETATGQHPFAVVLSCMDSRTSVELIFDQGLGDVFSIRIAGNVVNEDILGSMEYACQVSGSKLIVVLGHTKCGAIKGACEQVEMGHLTGLLQRIQPALEKVKEIENDCDNDLLAEKVAQLNVENSMAEILEKSNILNNLLENGKIGIVGGIYSVDKGTVDFTLEKFQGKINNHSTALATAHY